MWYRQKFGFFLVFQKQIQSARIVISILYGSEKVSKVE